jgi:hypothetical protein
MYYTLNTDTLDEVGQVVEAMAAAPSGTERRGACC